MRSRSAALACAGLLLAGVALSGCSQPVRDPTPGPTPATISAPAPSSAPAPPGTSSGSSAPATTSTPPSPSESSVSEPTTTNTLPPPPEPSRAAASTAGRLTSTVFPVPAGWRTVARKGGAEEGFEGNGTWVHARDPRYAATDTITIGCAEITRDDFRDPVSALEGNYENKAKQPGIALALQFRTDQAATDYYRRYQQQVRACTSPDGPVLITVLPSTAGLIDQRTYPDEGQWTEMVKLAGSRVTLIVLTDEGHTITRSAAETILAAIPR